MSSFVLLSSREDEEGGISDTFLSDDDIPSRGLVSDDDFVVLSRRRSPRVMSQTGVSTPDGDNAQTPNVAQLTSTLARLIVDDSNSSTSGDTSSKVAKHPVVARVEEVKNKRKKKKKGKKDAAGVVVEVKKDKKKSKKNASSVHVSAPASSSPPKASKTKAKEVKTAVLAQDVSDLSSERITEGTVYEEAVQFINSFLSNPEARENSACRLTLLQSLIIELGFATSPSPSLPTSLRSAKAFLKSRAFLNIREYLAVRGQGLAALQRIMHPSQASLIKEIKQKQNRVPRGWVKNHGLQVLMVKSY